MKGNRGAVRAFAMSVVLTIASVGKRVVSKEGGLAFGLAGEHPTVAVLA